MGFFISFYFTSNGSFIKKKTFFFFCSVSIWYENWSMSCSMAARICFFFKNKKIKWKTHHRTKRNEKHKWIKKWAIFDNKKHLNMHRMVFCFRFSFSYRLFMLPVRFRDEEEKETTTNNNNNNKKLYRICVMCTILIGMLISFG